MNRRGFLGSLVALVCAPFVPKVAPAAPRLVDRDTGIAIRFIRQFDVVAAKHVTRQDAWLAHGDQFTIAGDPVMYTAVDPFMK